jgi:hypothetical protein
MDGMVVSVIVLVEAFKRAADTNQNVALVRETEFVRASTDERDIHDDRHWRVTPGGLVVAPMVS